MEELDLEILPPTTNQGDENDTNFANRLLPRLDPEKLRSQPLLSHETPLPDSGKASKERTELARQLNDSLTITSGKKKKEKSILRDYDVMLNLTDVGKNNNKFYHIQILKTSSGYVLNTEWGRVGYDARDKKQVFQSKIDAIGAFEKKFYEKTYNEWSDRENFQTKAGKYTLISVAGGGMSKDTINSEIQRLNKRNQELKTRIDTLQSNLDPRIFSLMRLIWDINRMNKTLKELNFDTEKHPLGKLTSQQIQKGYSVLTAIQRELRDGAKETKLIELTNEFYTNIPQSFGMKKPPLIDNPPALREKIRMLDVLKELDVANKYIELALNTKSSDGRNPLDSFFDLLKIKINRIDSSHNAYMYIQNCLRTSHGPTHNTYSLSIIDLFEVERKGEKERFWPFAKIAQKALLWHGSRTTNFVGILSEGLKIAPPDAPSSGYMFGKGVYFADVPSKSANYCKATPENSEGLLLLCEVALGNTYRVYKAQNFKTAPKYFHSVYGVGKKMPNPEGRVLMEDGLIFESGEVKDNKELIDPTQGILDSSLDYNEFIVYDVGQVRIRYIVRVQFNYNVF